MADSKIPFTKAAYEAMQEHVVKLQTELGEVLVRLKDAREMGDLSENGAYKYAKFELGNIRRELRRLGYLINNGEVVVPASGEIVQFGSTVIVVSADGVTKEFQLVSKHETNPAVGKISLASPIGTVLSGKKAGDTVTVETPRGQQKYLIEEVR